MRKTDGKKILTFMLVVLVAVSFMPVLSYAEETCDHQWSDWETTSYADCYLTGSKWRYCYKCGESQEATIPRTKHKWSAWECKRPADCMTTGLEARYCPICLDSQYRTYPKAEHQWEAWKITAVATSYVQGKKTRVCSYCNARQTKVIPKRKITKNEKKACKVVNTYMKAAKKYNVNKMNKCFAKKSKKYGYPTEKIDWIFKKYNKRIKWKIVDVYVAGKTGYVDVKATHPNFYSQIYNAVYESLDWAWKKWGVNAGKHGNAIGDKILQKINKKVKKGKKRMETETVTFKMIKTSKGWKIKTKSKAVVNIATGNFDYAWEDAENDWEDDFY